MRRVLLAPSPPKSLPDLTFVKLFTIFENGKSLTKGEKQSVKLCHIEGNEYVIKRYEGHSLLSSFRLFIKQSRAHISYNFSKYLTLHKISCPRHLAVVTDIRLTKNTTFLLMEKAPGIPLFDYIHAATPLELSPQAITNTINLILKIHHHGVAHGDLHTRNLIIAPDNKVHIIDLDSMRFSKRRRKKDIQRFTTAVKKGSRYKEPILSTLENA